MSRINRRWVMAGVMVGSAGLGLLAEASPAMADSYSPNTAAAFVASINALRASHGLAPLSVDPALVSMADGWSVHLAAAGTLSHNPGLASEAPAGWRLLGENVGVGATEPALQAAFTASPEHYANMVDPAFNTIGVGVYVSSQGYLWVTEDYMEAPVLTAAVTSTASSSGAAPAAASLAKPIAAPAVASPAVASPAVAPAAPVRAVTPAPAPAAASAPAASSPASSAAATRSTPTSAPVQPASAPAASGKLASLAAPGGQISATVSTPRAIGRPAVARTGSVRTTSGTGVPAAHHGSFPSLLPELLTLGSLAGAALVVERRRLGPGGRRRPTLRF